MGDFLTNYIHPDDYAYSVAGPFVTWHFEEANVQLEAEEAQDRTGESEGGGGHWSAAETELSKFIRDERPDANL